LTTFFTEEPSAFSVVSTVEPSAGLVTVVFFGKPLGGTTTTVVTPFFTVVVVMVPSASLTVVVVDPSPATTVVVVTPFFVDVVDEVPSPLSVVVVTLPSASVSVVTVLLSLYTVTQVVTLLAVEQLGPLMIFDGAAVGVLVVQTPAPLVTVQWCVPWHVTSPHSQVPDNSEPSSDAHAEAGDGPLTKLPDAS
jgi:hypothetical protein